ncbi:uncharacterized protein COLE_06251 [Cutaneotrichosporon oleaginosum]|nr:hypothetical protein COLE_06251 [Cutaneotrichosporon oleaginosum]
MTVPVSFAANPAVHATALVDTGATQNFVHPDLVEQLGLELTPLRSPRSVQLADGSVAEVKSSVTAEIVFGDGFDAYTGTFYVFRTHPERVVLGDTFMRTVQPFLDYTQGRLRPRPTESMLVAAEQPRAVRHTVTNELDADEARELEAQLPHEYRDLADVFSPKLADRLPPHTEFDHAIELEPGARLRVGPCYQASAAQLQQLRDMVTENLKKGFIRESSSSFAAPTLFAKKKDGPDRICHDYRRLNAVTIKNRYPIPRIDMILDQITGADLFTTIDLRGAYNLVRIREGDEPKTAFRTPFGLFEYLVMLFGLCNAPSTFQKLMEHIFRDMIGISIALYLDDILVYTKADRPQHVRVTREVLLRLRKFRLFAKMAKCRFFAATVTFLGFVVSPNGLSMDPEKVAAILQWPLPRNAKDVGSFVGLANFYRGFVPAFTDIAPASRRDRGWAPQGEFSAYTHRRSGVESAESGDCIGPGHANMEPGPRGRRGGRLVGHGAGSGPEPDRR